MVLDVVVMMVIVVAIMVLMVVFISLFHTFTAVQFNAVRTIDN